MWYHVTDLFIVLNMFDIEFYIDLMRSVGNANRRCRRKDANFLEGLLKSMSSILYCKFATNERTIHHFWIHMLLGSLRRFSPRLDMGKRTPICRIPETDSTWVIRIKHNKTLYVKHRSPLPLFHYTLHVQFSGV